MDSNTATKEPIKTVDLSDGVFLNGFTKAFCYTKEGAIVVQGPPDKVYTYIQTLAGPFHYNIVQTYNNIKESVWLVHIDEGDCIFVRRLQEGGKKHQYILLYVSKHGVEEVGRFRRMPHHYLEEFASLCD